MIEFEQYKLSLNELLKSIEKIGEAINPNSLETKIKELEEKTLEPSFYEDMNASGPVLKKLKQLKGALGEYTSLHSKCDDALVLNELAMEMEDDSQVSEVSSEINSIEKELEALTLKTLLKGEYDYNNAILTLHAGAGGTEAQDWVEMLYRMYTMYCNNKGYSIKVLDFIEGNDAGIKSVTFLVSGDYAYGYLKGEKGVHRLVRISPFDSNKRRHTSFCSLDVVPEIEDDLSVEINPEDIRVDTYRASGAGGQHVNKTDSAIRITHLPSKIVVQCQNERSQIQNRETAMKMLRSKLVEIKERENMEKLNELKGEMKKIEWGSQIRSYVFHPYSMVKDHRTSAQSGNVTAVMDGDLELFINEYLKMC